MRIFAGKGGVWLLLDHKYAAKYVPLVELDIFHYPEHHDLQIVIIKKKDESAP